MVKVARGGKKAITRYAQVEPRGDNALIRFELVTGRMHQIRVQAALADFSVVGDPLYGEAQHNKGLPGQLLHASELSFEDPLSGQTISICAPLPDSFAMKSRAPAATESRYLKFHKPYGVLCQFTPNTPGEPCLGDFGLPPKVYPVGRLDKDSEGLLLLTNDGKAAHRLAAPKSKQPKTYWVQVEGEPSDDSLERLAQGVIVKGYRTRPCQVRRLEGAVLPPRDPPIRERKSIPTRWLEITLVEGKNRQVRRMTAAVGHPTLRLVRVAVGGVTLDGLEVGTFEELSDF
jgi:23S rRNA pseudouridine2457 synthase